MPSLWFDEVPGSYKWIVTLTELFISTTFYLSVLTFHFICCCSCLNVVVATTLSWLEEKGCDSFVSADRILLVQMVV